MMGGEGGTSHLCQACILHHCFCLCAPLLLTLSFSSIPISLPTLFNFLLGVTSLAKERKITTAIGRPSKTISRGLSVVERWRFLYAGNSSSVKGRPDISFLTPTQLHICLPLVAASPSSCQLHQRPHSCRIYHSYRHSSLPLPPFLRHGCCRLQRRRCGYFTRSHRGSTTDTPPSRLRGSRESGGGDTGDRSA